ncbi:hypothetical protein PVAP13_9KG091000 [Panicum virgatum]|uniref:Ricin B lectin domain-containing protein n=1 Tax=Panicum virgatum TaxID=38727 RepID=A0A8T0NS48_PANVG|nr:hypothetical protein PVAP13_9KG091000 [Panicum virgatum]
MASTFRIRCRASEDLTLAVGGGEPILTKADGRDDRLLWLKDLAYGAGVTDEAGSPAFALVKEATEEVLKHSLGHGHPVRAVKLHLAGYSEEDLGDGFRRVHMVNNRDFILDAEEAIPDLGGARDGTRLILFRWNGGLNQQWRIAPHGAPVPAVPEHARPLRILCQSGQGLSLTCWIQSFRNAGHVTDGAGRRAFALVNRATGKALGRRRGDELVCLGGHRPDSVDVALLWTQSDDLSEGFHHIRTVGDVDTVLDAANGVPEAGGAHDGTPILVFPWNGGCNQKWKMLPFY